MDKERKKKLEELEGEERRTRMKNQCVRIDNVCSDVENVV